MRFHALLLRFELGMVQGMKRRMVSEFRQVGGFAGCWSCFCLVVAARSGAEEPSPAAVSAFNAYVRGVEARLAGQHRSQTGFIACVGEASAGDARRWHGELIVEKLTPPDLRQGWSHAAPLARDGVCAGGDGCGL